MHMHGTLVLRFERKNDGGKLFITPDHRLCSPSRGALASTAVGRRHRG
jgi:hypothetical protein